jgi:uncharacterized membrane protein
VFPAKDPACFVKRGSTVITKKGVRIMAKTVVGLFSDKTDADNAVNALRDAGFVSNDISIVVKDTAVSEDLQKSKGEQLAEGAVGGAATGGVIGGIIGLIAGVTAVALPGLGALLIAGPLAAALGLTGAAATTVSGAITGAVAGGLVGALVSLGMPQEQAERFEERIARGDILLAVDTTTEGEDKAREVFTKHNAEEVSTLNV